MSPGQGPMFKIVYDSSMKSLDYIDPGESGLNSFNRDEFKRKLQDHQVKTHKPDQPYQFLALFVFGKFEELAKIFKDDPSLISSIEIKALKILNSLCLQETISSRDLFPFVSPELTMKRKIGKRVSKQLLDYYKSISSNLSNFKNIPEWQAIDFWSVSEAIPEIEFIYVQYILENNLKEQFNKVKEFIETKREEINNPEIKTELELEQKYLQAFYYRRIGDKDKAEKASLDYFMLYKPDPDQSSTIKSYGNQNFYQANQVLENWDKILDEADQLQRDVETKAGLEQMTCDYYKCSDCCSNTFPSMTSTEYKYLEDWMKENNYPVEAAKAAASKIQEDHRELHGSELKIVNKEDPEFAHRGSENKHSFKFSCPFLKDHQCSIYQARPLLCRGFGLSNDNDFSIKSCKYYLAQYRYQSSPDNERQSYDLRPAQMLAASADRASNEGKHLVGTIVAWLSS